MRRFALSLSAAAALTLLSGCAYDRDYYGYQDGYYDDGYSGGGYYNNGYRDRDYRYDRDRTRNYYGMRGYRY